MKLRKSQLLGIILAVCAKEFRVTKYQALYPETVRGRKHISATTAMNMTIWISTSLFTVTTKDLVRFFNRNSGIIEAQRDASNDFLINNPPLDQKTWWHAKIIGLEMLIRADIQKREAA